MKKVFIIFMAAAIVCLSFIMVPAALSVNAEVYGAEGLRQLNEQEIKDVFNGFIENNVNRYSFNADNKGGEAYAAEYIAGKLIEIGYPEEQVITNKFSAEFSVSSNSIFQSSETETKYSQNVVLRLQAADSSVKNRIVIGCDYDNTYDNSSLSVGAIDNASGVAVCLGLAYSFFNVQMPMNVDIVFFGAGYYSYSGSAAYIDEYGLSNIAAMINVTRVSMGDVYLYCDEISTPLETFILNCSFDYGNFIQKMPSSVPLLNSEYVSGYPYTHIGLAGNHSHFLSRGIPVANIFGGDSSSLSLKWNIEYDTVSNMESSYPDCYKNMVKTGSLLSAVIFSDGLIAAALGSKSALDSPLMKPWIAYIIFVAVVIAVVFCIWFLSRYYIKKYPIMPQKKVLPVFGSEYE